MITLTYDLIASLATERGGYTKATLAALSVPWDSTHHSGYKGWRRSLEGKKVTQYQFEKAQAGRTIYGNQQAKA